MIGEVLPWCTNESIELPRTDFERVNEANDSTLRQGDHGMTIPSELALTEPSALNSTGETLWKIANLSGYMLEEGKDVVS